MNQHKEHIIRAKELSIGFSNKKKTTVVADHLNFEIQKGSFNCILGRNGIGKSTLLRTLSKVQLPLKGSIFIKNKNLSSFTNLEIAKELSLVLSETLPESNLTVLEFIALGRQPYTNWIGTLTAADKKIINKVIALTGIGDFIHKKYYELSDGQFQRVLISRALVQDTDVIILDEPTHHLDIEHTLETFSLLEKLAREEHKTIIISTHQIQLALQYAHKLFLMTDSGFITGTAKELIENKSMEKLFDSNSITFDPDKEQFTLKPLP